MSVEDSTMPQPTLPIPERCPWCSEPLTPDEDGDRPLYCPACGRWTAKGWCKQCRRRIPPGKRSHARFCSVECRAKRYAFVRKWNASVKREEDSQGWWVPGGKGKWKMHMGASPGRPSGHYEKACLKCRRRFHATRHDAVFCSPKCKMKVWREKKKR
jgi:hypothetical protein